MKRRALALGAGAVVLAAASVVVVVRMRQPAAPASTAPLPSAGAQLSGRVLLAPALQAEVKADDTVFIFARVLDGPRGPVALLKRRAGELPLDFVLDERAATNPTLRLSPSMRLVVGARIARAGQDEPQPGDLQGVLAPVGVGSSGLVVEIASRLQ